jgi:uncharacterized protein (UPF0335 family)
VATPRRRLDAGGRAVRTLRPNLPITEKDIQMDDPIAGDQLKSIVERIERLEEEKKTIADDIKEVYAEAKGNGYDVKVLRKVIAIRKRDANERAEEEAILDLYLQAVGESA